MKRLFLLLSLCLFAGINAFSNADNGEPDVIYNTEIDGIYYMLGSHTATVSYQREERRYDYGEYQHYYYSNYSGDVVIPESVTYDGVTYVVTSIGDYAFTNSFDRAIDYGSEITSITIPTSVKSIGCLAFARCLHLTSISIPESVKSISIGAFFGCRSLSSINIPNSVTSIEERAFD